MRRNGLGDPRGSGSLAQRALQGLVIDVVPSDPAGTGVGRQARRGKDVLPAPLSRGVGVLSFECIGKMDSTESREQVFVMQRLHPDQMLPEWFPKTGRQHRDAVLSALAVPDQDLQPGELHILQPQARPFHHPHARAIQQPQNQRRRPGGSLENRPHLVHREHHGQSTRLLRLLHIVQPRELDAEDFPIQKQERRLGLVLRRGGDVTHDRQMRQERLHRGSAQVARMPFAVVQHVPANPVGVNILGTDAVVLETDPVSYLVQRTRRLPGHVFTSPRWTCDR